MVDTADARTDLVVFGASGDLAARKILPALRRLLERGELRTPLRVIGVGRSDLSDQAIQEQLGEAADGGQVKGRWLRIRYDAPESYKQLKAEVAGARAAIFYLATPPATFNPIVNA